MNDSGWGDRKTRTGYGGRGDKGRGNGDKVIGG